MAWIEVIDEEEAQGKLREIYEKLTEPWGRVDNIIKISRQSHTDYGHNKHPIISAARNRVLVPSFALRIIPNVWHNSLRIKCLTGLEALKRRIMAWIKVIPEEKATGRLKELYEKYKEPSGEVDGILKIHSLNVKSLQTHYDMYAHLMRGRSDLSRTQREMIAVVVSAANRCHY